ncbi:MAG: chemotaxis protein CheA [Proteobacteria bacterium]|nr:chemotaxis protein CheA [Pseudomonadota bacterium]
MNAMLEQFIVEARDFLDGIGAKLIAMEDQPDDVDLMNELFRIVHTLKGNSGLFDFADMSRVLHASEDLMDTVRSLRVPYSRDIADTLLEAMDFVGRLLDEIEAFGALQANHAQEAGALATALRALIGDAMDDTPEAAPRAAPAPLGRVEPLFEIAEIPEASRLDAFSRAKRDGRMVLQVLYAPEEECFFKGEDPFHQARTMPGVVWGRAVLREAPASESTFDCYRCIVDFQALTVADQAELDEHFRYVPEQVTLRQVALLDMVIPQGERGDGTVYGAFVDESLANLARDDRATVRAATQTLLELSGPDLWQASALRWLLALLEHPDTSSEDLHALLAALRMQQRPNWDRPDAAANAIAASGTRPDGTAPVNLAGGKPAIQSAQSGSDGEVHVEILRTQSEILALSDDALWLPGRLKACAATIAACIPHGTADPAPLERALQEALHTRSASPLRAWLGASGLLRSAAVCAQPSAAAVVAPEPAVARALPAEGMLSTATVDVDPKVTGRRSEDSLSNKILKVDQAKVDYLMNLIGEMVVAKNALPFLANRAERQGGGRDLAREIKAQYTVINRIAEEMQDAIMQVRMMPVSVVFQRFPRLVRDIAHKLGKEINLQLEGDHTEADKNIVEAIGDPLIHLVRNSLDHGIEDPATRLAAGKPAAGTLRISATQESDRVVIEVSDDGRGIDPAVIKRKAYEKGLINEAALESISDQEAVNLVFAAGFSTVEKVSDLSGRGVGMDVVRSAMDKVGGTVDLRSVRGQGSIVRLSLPLSMAVSNVMIVESDDQIFGIPMDAVVETVRVARDRILLIKSRQTIVLRNRVVPLFTLNSLLGLNSPPQVNDDGEIAALLVRVGPSTVGLLVDGFRGVSDVILKPLPGELAKLSAYAGSALLGDGSVLMVLNAKELFK